MTLGRLLLGRAYLRFTGRFEFTRSLVDAVPKQIDQNTPFDLRPAPSGRLDGGLGDRYHWFVTVWVDKELMTT